MKRREYHVKWCTSLSFDETGLTSVDQLSQGSVVSLDNSGDLLLAIDIKDGKPVGDSQKIALDEIASFTFQAGKADDAPPRGNEGHKFSWRCQGQGAVKDFGTPCGLCCTHLRLVLFNGTIVEISDIPVAEAISLLKTVHSKWIHQRKLEAELVASSFSASCIGIGDTSKGSGGDVGGANTATLPETPIFLLDRYIASKCQTAEPALANASTTLVPSSVHGGNGTSAGGRIRGHEETNRYATLLQGWKTRSSDDVVSCDTHVTVGHRNIVLHLNAVGGVSRHVGGQSTTLPPNYPDVSNPCVFHNLHDPTQRTIVPAAGTENNDDGDAVDDAAEHLGRRGVFLLRKLREKTGELEKTKAELLSLHETMKREAEHRLQQERTLVKKFIHLTPSQRALLNFDAMLEPTVTVDELRQGAKECTVRNALGPSLRFSSVFLQQLRDCSFTPDNAVIQGTVVEACGSTNGEPQHSPEQRRVKGGIVPHFTPVSEVSTPNRHAVESLSPGGDLPSEDPFPVVPPPPPPPPPPR